MRLIGGVVQLLKKFARSPSKWRFFQKNVSSSKETMRTENWLAYSMLKRGIRVVRLLPGNEGGRNIDIKFCRRSLV